MMFEEFASIVDQIATSRFWNCVWFKLLFSTSLIFEGEAGIQVLELEEVWVLNDFV